ncbi:histidinol-phosphate transaminase [Lentzea flava]|uniref:Aromatic amino acid aminotransferase n=1 Tax=Lentzea flava TaxID=103732 RepID=A0ABQ2UCX5_9PSEU|nr:histidinol-phosphate transaminase [Lentzea flava]MCP2197783.1 histidinol-phosphate aminotransferase [Lentzea flava]GGU22155.1 putative phenylalanine aminotransferase [Lentzea flava]
MTVRTRADLASLPSYVPGRTIPGAIKLASNEVSAGPLPSVVKAIAEAATGINRYPDSGCTELTGRLADKLGVPADHLALGCGSVTLCQQLVQATCTENDEVLFAWRSFEAYPIVTHVAGAKQIRVPLTEGHVHDLDAMAAAITPNTRMVFVCNPNNPTGTALRTEEIEAFIAKVPNDVLVVIDEAYKEFVDDAHIPDGVELAKQQWAAGRDNVAVLRTFSKAYGLAGLRIGYAVAQPHVAEALRKVYVPFSVNALAQVAAMASLDAEDELMVRCRAIVAERTRVRGELLAMGYEVPETQANFVWLPLGERTAAFNEHCLAHKVVVRAFVGEGARVTIGEPEENDAFLAAARAFTS